MLAAGALPNLLPLVHAEAKLSFLRNATWTLSNFCRGKPHPSLELVGAALPVLAQLIYSQVRAWRILIRVYCVLATLFECGGCSPLSVCPRGRQTRHPPGFFSARSRGDAS